MARYDDRPKTGEFYKGAGRDGAKTEQRRIVDRTLGGGVVFHAGRVSRFAIPETVTRAQWDEWAATARCLNPAEN